MSVCRSVAIVGGGPAGLMAAEVLVQRALKVTVFDTMPSVGRKFLMAGKGGLNLTHAEPREAFLDRYGSRRPWLEPMLQAFGPDALRTWTQALGVDTFVGSSGRVFPTDMKAAPLLRAWLHRLRDAGVEFRVRHRWLGWSEGLDNSGQRLMFNTPAGAVEFVADALVLALGGGSWPQLGSDGAWVSGLRRRGVEVADLLPANCGFDVGWSAHFAERFAGEPVKSVVASFARPGRTALRRAGELVITASGVEGSLIYALSAPLRDAIAQSGEAILWLDLAPGKDERRVHEELSHPRGSRSLASHLQSRVGIKGVKTGLLRECVPAEAFHDPARLAAAIKSLLVRLRAPRPLAEAISSAGGVRFEALDAHLMLHALPGVFCAGEMLDWEAPTGGYLLTACFASGYAAGQGAAAWLDGACP